MKFYLYGHGGSDNHGCEAIVRSTCSILNRKKNNFIKLYSHRKSQDEKYGLNDCVSEITEYNRYFKKNTFRFYINYLLWKIFKYNNYFYSYANYELLKNIDSEGIYLSIGGDNYCYGNYYKNLSYINRKLSSEARTVLWGASIEPDIIEKLDVIKDLNRYSKIIVRESITYEALVKVGLKSKTEIIPDPAFILSSNYTGKIEHWADNVIGINISPLVQRIGGNGNIVYENVKNLIHYIMDKTNYSIALIPHVVENNNSDFESLSMLYKDVEYHNRVYLVEDCNCMELKYIISKCKMFIGARTHSTIAAYSSCVPTLVIGYSVKAKGIAKDLFGTYENYVIPVQELNNTSQLIDSFNWLSSNEDKIRKYLQAFMPDYKDRVNKFDKIIEELSYEKEVLI